MQAPSCDIVIPVFNKPDLTRDCLGAIYGRTHMPFNLILIDNGSDDDTRVFLETFRKDHGNASLIRNDKNLGWIKALNQGIAASKSPYICAMNNDALVRNDGWLSKMILVAQSAPDIGLINPEFEVKKKVHNAPYIEVDFCRGYCILIKREVVDRIGLFDESYGMGYYDDDDYSVRAIRAGFRCVRVSDVLVEHLKDTTFSDFFTEDKRRAMHEKNKKLFYSKWGDRLNLLFIITRDVDKSSLSELLFFLARRQHIVYLWTAWPLLGLEHINIRERTFPLFCHEFFFSAALYFNMIKKMQKRYKMIFVDSAAIGPILWQKDLDIHYIDVEKDAGEIKRVVDSAAKR